MKRSINVAVIFGLMGMASTAMGSAIPPSLIIPVMGESEVFSFVQNDHVTIDWMVIDAGPMGLGPSGAFAYLFQIENTSANGMVNALSITLPAGADAGIISVGEFTGDDLDLATGFHPAHDVSVDPVLSTEGEGLTFRQVNSTVSMDNGNITWQFASRSLLAGEESQTLFFVHPDPPKYGNATINGGPVNPAPWATTAPGSDQVPVPNVIPEPASLALLAVGAAFLGMPRVRRRNKA